MTRRLLSVGAVGSDNGYGRIGSELLPHLLDAFEVHHFGIDHAGPITVRGGLVVHPNPSRVDALGIEAFAQLAAAMRPEVVFVHQDPVIAQEYLHALRRHGVSSRIVVCASLDAQVTRPGWAHLLAGADTLVFYTAFAREQYQWAKERTEMSSPGPSSVHVIPNGTNTERFYPVDRDLARRAVLGPHDPGPGAFIVLNANQHHPRKNVPLTLAGFAAFARGKPPEVKLWLHMARKRYGADLVSLAYDHGIRDRLILTDEIGDGSDEDYKVPVEQLNLIYNACDVGINTSWGEGWGLIAFEHAAARRPQVVPGWFSTAELWRGAAELLPSVERLDDPFGPYRFEGSAPCHVATALERLYADADHRESLAAAGRERATASRYGWPEVAERWREILIAA